MGLTLDDLGPRICVLGPSSAGKSTLAAAIGRARGHAVFHLDQMHHQPGTDWKPRAPGAFDALHAEAIAGDRWVIDGNYSGLLPARLARATGVILTDAPTVTRLWRYFRRTLFEKDRRFGGLPGAPERLKWEMIHYVAVLSAAKNRRYAAKLARSGLPLIELQSPAALARFYRTEGLREAT